LLSRHSLPWSYVGRARECKVCRKRSTLISKFIGVCADCIRERPDEALPHTMEAHAEARSSFGLPTKPPKSPGGIKCNFCFNECEIGVGEAGFCGLRENVDGKLKSLVSPERGLLYTYLDPQVTNCCAAWFCPAGTGAGYPKYACKPGPEVGYYNFAVFFYGCNFDCLFCQNASHKELWRGDLVTVEEFTGRVRRNDRVSCICYFGGSPEPQLPFAIRASKAIMEENPKRILRVCFEWNGCGHRKLVKEAAELALLSGGNVKFDLKCFDPNMSLALSRVDNERAYENFRMVAEELYCERPSIPVLTATTLLVPSYVDSLEVEQIAEFIAKLNPAIPYSLLVFQPKFLMSDLPITPYGQVLDCYKAAKKHLKRVNVGNLHLVGVRDMSEIEATMK